MANVSPKDKRLLNAKYTYTSQGTIYPSFSA
jgi:hypothetical protein